VYGTVAASFTVEDFSVHGLLRAQPDSLQERYSRLAEITRIETPLRFRPRDLITEGA
jgi:hypothetical protein